jgi:hypothetical protein
MAWIWEKLLLKMDASSKKMGQLIVFVISIGKLNHISCVFMITEMAYFSSEINIFLTMVVIRNFQNIFLDATLPEF